MPKPRTMLSVMACIVIAKKPAAVEAEAEARAINAEPWEPMAGMVKRQCPECHYFFASPVESAERRCADCAAVGTGLRITARRNGSFRAATATDGAAELQIPDRRVAAGSID